MKTYYLFKFSQGTNPTKLEVNHIRNSDMSTDDEERAGGEVRGYEKKIHNLMNEVGTLKNEVNIVFQLFQIESLEFKFWCQLKDFLANIVEYIANSHPQTHLKYLTRLIGD